MENPDSLKIVSKNHAQRVEEFVPIMNGFSQMFKDYVKHEDYQKNQNEAFKFLLDNGVSKAYTVVLEDKTEVVHSY